MEALIYKAISTRTQHVERAKVTVRRQVEWGIGARAGQSMNDEVAQTLRVFVERLDARHLGIVRPLTAP